MEAGIWKLVHKTCMREYEIHCCRLFFFPRGDVIFVELKVEKILPNHALVIVEFRGETLQQEAAAGCVGPPFSRT